MMIHAPTQFVVLLHLERRIWYGYMLDKIQYRCIGKLSEAEERLVWDAIISNCCRSLKHIAKNLFFMRIGVLKQGVR